MKICNLQAYQNGNISNNNNKKTKACKKNEYKINMKVYCFNLKTSTITNMKKITNAK